MDKEVRSDEARRQWSDLLDSVEHHDAHITVLRYAKPAAVIVPVWWHELAITELAEEGEQS